jgi:putative tricarboxylic transport membrane protein
MSDFGRFTASMRRGEIVAGVLLLLFGAAILIGSLRMSAGTAGAPGPGYFPRFLGTLLVLVSIGLIVRAARLKSASDTTVVLGHRDIAITLIALVALGLLFEPAGYILSATLFMLALLRAFSTLGWVRSFVAALVVVLVSYYLFDKALGVTLPAGILRFQ